MKNNQNNQNNQNQKNQKNQDCGNKNGGSKNGEKDCNNHSYSRDCNR